MSEPPKNADWLVVLGLVLAVFLIPLGLYFAGYYAMGEAADFGDSSPMILRTYGTDWQATIFTPAAMIESLCRGIPVSTMRGPCYPPDCS